MDENNHEAKQPIAAPMTIQEILAVTIIGAVLGVVLWAVGLLFYQYVATVYFCSNDSSLLCRNSDTVSELIATILAAGVVLVGLVRLRVYRPLLVLIGVLVALWGTVGLTWQSPWYQGALVSLLLYALGVLLFAWLARVRNFLFAIGAIAACAVVVRLLVLL